MEKDEIAAQESRLAAGRELTNRKPIPKFESEEEEWEFWATHDSTEYVDWSRARPVPFSRSLR